MCMMKLVTKTITADTRIGSPSDIKGTIGTSRRHVNRARLS
jgi:hypothetical protein